MRSSSRCIQKQLELLRKDGIKDGVGWDFKVPCLFPTVLLLTPE